MAGASITPAELRAYANLPSEVPEALLTAHIGIALRDLVAAVGVVDAPADKASEWAEALTVRALASVFPWLNTFALDGASKVGRLEGAVEHRFLDTEDVAGRVATLNARFGELCAQIAPPATTEDPNRVDLGANGLMAI